jgi:uncharacterized protein YheU (UPF0270 family)
MEVPWQKLSPEALQALMEEFITREGTDYGSRERTMESKVAELRHQLETGQARIVFDPETESCDIRERLGARAQPPA